jgi:tetratricopeptide (TPR) repeat protein
MLGTIRHYTRDHLGTSGTLTTARDRHSRTVMDAVADAVGDLWGRDESRAVAWFDAAHADVIEAYRWLKDRGAVADVLQLAVDSYLFGWSHGRAILRELIIDATTTAESAHATTSRDLLALAYGAAAAAANTAGDGDEAHRLWAIGVDHARHAEEPSLRLCHGVAADLALFAGDTNAAAEHYQLAAAGFRSGGIAAMAAYLDAASGLALTYGGNNAKARPILEQSVAAADHTGCPSARAFARYALAELLAAENPTLAQHRLEEAIELAQSVSATFVAGVAELSLATLHARTGRPRAALAHYPTLIDLWRLAGNWTQQWNTLRTLVFVLADLDDYRATAELMAAIAASGAEPTWGDDAAAWAKVRAKVHAQLEPSMIETAELTAHQLGRGEVLALAEAHVRAAEAHMATMEKPTS